MRQGIGRVVRVERERNGDRLGKCVFGPLVKTRERETVATRMSAREVLDSVCLGAVVVVQLRGVTLANKRSEQV